MGAVQTITMYEPSKEEIIQMIQSRFEVVGMTRSEYALEFEISDQEFKTKFEDLARWLEGMKYACRMAEADGKRYIIVQKFADSKSRLLSSPWTPRVLFAVVVAFVMVDGHYRASGANSVVPIGDPLEMAMVYTLALLGILGVHELGHIAVARMHGLKTTWPFFMPGLPVVGIPTFGAFIQSRGLTINREILFDVAIAGPVAGLVIAVAVSVYGAYTAPVIDDELASSLFASGQLVDWSQGEPLLMTASLALFGKGGEAEVIMTPVMFAAWIGFLITFLNMLPAWQLDGGHMARTLFGPKVHKYATYGSMAVLILLGYWMMAVLILLMRTRSPSATPLDDISPLSRNRKFAYVSIVALAVLCAPLPSGPIGIF